MTGRSVGTEDGLLSYRPDLPVPPDFDGFWADTLAMSRAAARPAVLASVDTPVTELDLFDLTFTGFAGEPIRAWVAAPRGATAAPAVVEYRGYSFGRGVPGERVHWAVCGYVHVVMDNRGQGSLLGNGADTPDPHGSGPAAPGFVTRGLGDPREHFYRRLFTDAALLVDAVRELPFVDAARVAVTGISQGGGTAIAAAALAGDGVAAVMPDVPFLCDIPGSLRYATAQPMLDLVHYLSVHRANAAQALETLSYLDAATLATRAVAPALFSVGLRDEVVPAATVYAAFNRYGGADRELAVYPYNGHEGGMEYHWLRQAAWLAPRLAVDALPT
ncbi:MAG: acetylxylan esterase [Microbacteriaceae bacterium]|nr:acetylxylan esterase [Microbacteriaceae bacterium]